MPTFGTIFVDLYETCQRVRSPEECRAKVATAAAQMANAYLVAYDTCKRGFTADRCKTWLTGQESADGGFPTWAKVVAIGAGVLLLRRL